MQFVDDGLRMLNVLDDLDAESGVEGGVGVGKMLGILMRVAVVVAVVRGGMVASGDVLLAVEERPVGREFLRKPPGGANVQNALRRPDHPTEHVLKQPGRSSGVNHECGRSRGCRIRR